MRSKLSAVRVRVLSAGKDEPPKPSASHQSADHDPPVPPRTSLAGSGTSADEPAANGRDARPRKRPAKYKDGNDSDSVPQGRKQKITRASPAPAGEPAAAEGAAAHDAGAAKAQRGGEKRQGSQREGSQPPPEQPTAAAAAADTQADKTSAAQPAGTAKVILVPPEGVQYTPIDLMSALQKSIQSLAGKQPAPASSGGGAPAAAAATASGAQPSLQPRLSGSGASRGAVAASAPTSAPAARPPLAPQPMQPLVELPRQQSANTTIVMQQGGGVQTWQQPQQNATAQNDPSVAYGLSSPQSQPQQVVLQQGGQPAVQQGAPQYVTMAVPPQDAQGRPTQASAPQSALQQSAMLMRPHNSGDMSAVRVSSGGVLSAAQSQTQQGAQPWTQGVLRLFDQQPGKAAAQPAVSSSGGGGHQQHLPGNFVVRQSNNRGHLAGRPTILHEQAQLQPQQSLPQPHSQLPQQVVQQGWQQQQQQQTWMQLQQPQGMMQQQQGYMQQQQQQQPMYQDYGRQPQTHYQVNPQSQMMQPSGMYAPQTVVTGGGGYGNQVMGAPQGTVFVKLNGNGQMMQVQQPQQAMQQQLQQLQQPGRRVASSVSAILSGGWGN